MPNALTMRPGKGRPAKPVSKTVGTPGVRPAGTHDPSCAHDEVVMRQQHDWYADQAAGPEWLRAREREESRRRLARAMDTYPGY